MENDEKLNTLEVLRDAMIANAPTVLDRFGQWRSDLPTFGGDYWGPPPSTIEVWSWDKSRMLVGTCADDLEIISRCL